MMQNKWLGFMEIHQVLDDTPFPYVQFIQDGCSTDIEITQDIDYKDKNKRKIFVGDWVFDDEDKELYLVLFDGEKLFARRYITDYRCYCENCQSDNPKVYCWTHEDLDLYYALSSNAVVVGNMFEHPDLYATFDYGERD